MLYVPTYRKSFFVAIAGLILLTFSPLQAVVVWSGTATDVTNDNISITADSLVSGPVTVTANDGAAYNITLGGANRTLFGDGTLLFNVSNGSSFTFILSDNLTLQGSANNSDMIIGICADATSSVNIQLQGANQLILSGNSGTSLGGVKMFVIMQSTLPNPAPSLIFTRVSGSSDTNVTIGYRSMLSFLAADVLGGSPAATSTGAIQWNVQNSGTGQTILNILDDGSYVTAGHLYTGGCVAANLVASNIAFTQPAGAQAYTNVYNPIAATGYLTVANSNTVISPLMADPFLNNSYASGDGIRRGFVVGANGTLGLGDNTYLNYIGLALNDCPITCDSCLNPLIKSRNGSALIVDGLAPMAYGAAFYANFVLDGSSAIYFRSGVNNKGVFSAPDYFIDPALRSSGIGNIVFDVEGRLDIFGANLATNALQVLSLAVLPTGGSVTIDSSETTFPLRSFSTDAFGVLQQYNAGAFFINNQLNLNAVSLVHTDQIHQVYEKNCTTSEPTYVGGETFVLEKSLIRPAMNFFNAALRVHTNIASTGVDLRVPNLVGDANFSNFIFYYNGYCVDKGDGRDMILGTAVGSFGCDGSTPVDADSHLDVMQTTTQLVPYAQVLNLQTAPNNSSIIQNVPTGITGQYSLNSFYLGNNSNFSIGSEGLTGTDIYTGATFACTTSPDVYIVGNYIAFETRGGTENDPESGSFTGRGAIFVDNFGTLALACPIRAYFATMVVQSGTGNILLPKPQIVFDNRVGFANWQVNLASPVTRILVSPSATFSDYTLDWLGVQKDCQNYVPYSINTCSPCGCPPVTAANITEVPTVQGHVDQFQILHSQLGNEATIKVDGGVIEELVFLEGTKSGEIAGGFVVIQNNASVGLGFGDTSQDSLSAAVTLGANGVTIIANGPGIIQLNDDIVIDNYCAFVAGPDFGVYGQDKLIIRSDTPNTILVKTGGILDLSSFTTQNMVLEFDDSAMLVMEPGSQLVLGGGVLSFVGNSQLDFRQIRSQNLPAGTSVSSSNPIRTIIAGVGTIQLKEDSRAFVGRGTVVGIETLPGCNTITNITLNIKDRAAFQMGNDASFGGSFQVGNATNTVGSSVTFNLNVTGIDAVFELNSLGFFGMGVGIVNRTPSGAPNTWLVGSLYNVDSINLNFVQGYFRNQQIRDGSDVLASLMAIGPVTSGYTFAFDPINVRVLGGGNMVFIPSGTISVTPTVSTTDSSSTSIMSSTLMLTDTENKTTPVGLVSAQALFAYLKVDQTTVQGTTQAAISLDTLGSSIIGYVFNSTIVRTTDYTIIGQGGSPVDATPSLVIGSVGLGVNTAGVITQVSQLSPVGQVNS